MKVLSARLWVALPDRRRLGDDVERLADTLGELIKIPRNNASSRESISSDSFISISSQRVFVVTLYCECRSEGECHQSKDAARQQFGLPTAFAFQARAQFYASWICNLREFTA